MSENNKDDFDPSNLQKADLEKKKKKDKYKFHPNDITEENNPFEDDELLTFVNIRFPGNAKAQPFLVGEDRLSYRQKVMAMSDRGVTVGYVNSLNYEKKFDKSMFPLRKILRLASDEDLENQKSQVEAEIKAENICLDLISKHSLNMNVTHVEIMQFGKKAVFYFTAPQRVDFRELVKGLVSSLKMRIELRQITVRDRAAAIGALGSCGRQNCCSSFLKGYGNVSIKMAKNQNIALLPSKINGVCGQLKCCLKYEDDVYSNKRTMLPSEGSIVKLKCGDIGKVLRLHVLAERFDVLTDKGAKRRYAKSEFIKARLPEGYKFPDRFDHIVDETSEVIGKEDHYCPKKDLFTDRFGAQEEIIDVIKDTDLDNLDKGQPEKKPNNRNNNNRNRNNNNRNRNNKQKQNPNQKSGNQKQNPNQNKQNDKDKSSQPKDGNKTEGKPNKPNNRRRNYNKNRNKPNPNQKPKSE